MIDPKNYNYIILVECIGSVNKTILLILLISSINILYKYCQYKDLYSSNIINIIEIDYINNTIMLE